MGDNSLIYEDFSYKINGILFKVHNQLGRFCNEKQYSDCIESYLKKNNIPYVREYRLPKSFAGEYEGRNQVDFLVEEKIIIEVKAKKIITREDYYQTLRYLVALNKKLAILVNFDAQYLHPKRVLNSHAQL